MPMMQMPMGGMMPMMGGMQMPMMMPMMAKMMCEMSDDGMRCTIMPAEGTSKEMFNSYGEMIMKMMSSGMPMMISCAGMPMMMCTAMAATAPAATTPGTKRG